MPATEPTTDQREPNQRHPQAPADQEAVDDLERIRAIREAQQLEKFCDRWAKGEIPDENTHDKIEAARAAVTRARQAVRSRRGFCDNPEYWTPQRDEPDRSRSEPNELRR